MKKYLQMRKILSIVLLFFMFIGLIPKSLFAGNNNDTYFIVTAYYSPLPNQKHYLKGNYEAEKRLNGQGIAGASGKPVFSGMLAAPKNYRFGTKIQLDGLGVGEVADRGGAIVNAGNRGYHYDRIDVWVGYGDEGLQRALYWGKRKVKGRIINSNSKVNLDYKNIPAPKWATNGLKSIPSIFNVGIGVGGNRVLVKKLQDFLREISLYNGKSDGIYNKELINTVYNFQVNNGILNPGDTYGAGYWGSKTRNLVLKKYLNGSFDKNVTETKIEEQEIKEVAVEKKEVIDPKFRIFNAPVKKVEDIKELQEILTKLELYNGEIDGNYDNLIDIIADYQVENKIVASYKSAGIGYFGPKTRTSVLELYKQYFKDEEGREKLRIEQEKQRLEEEKRKKELEEKFKRLEELSYTEASKKVEKIGAPKVGTISVGVRELQNLLKSLGYFDYKDTAIFGEKTKEALIDYQLDNNIIESKDDKSAGIFGPKTKKSLKDNIAKLILEEKVDSDKKLADYKKGSNLISLSTIDKF